VFRSADGTSYVLTVQKFPVDFAGQKAVLIVAFDLTRVSELMQERAALERKVLETQRLESLGVMAGGIAHDFNNLLVGVLANADLALADASVGPDAARYIGRLKGAAQRLATLSRQMLAYSGRARFSSELLNLGDETTELLELITASIPKHVRVQTDLPADLPRVPVDATQMRQVILNLVTNAAEALAGRPGTVQIAAREGRFDPAEHEGLTLGAEIAAGSFVCLTVRDDGDGMSARTLQRLFDPFFTTKGSGRGLGLAAVLGIVRAHRGALQVRSLQGKGTVFRIWLPAAPGTAEHEVPSRDAPSGAREPLGEPSAPPTSALDAAHHEPHAEVGQQPRVLVVDDEPVVRTATAAVLQAFGFVVEAAEDGDQAIRAVQATPDLQAVLLDVTMPGRSVTATHTGIRELRPTLPIVLTSGFSEQDVIADLLLRGPTSFLPKPYSAQDLVDRLRSAMGGSG
jgi:signal transduction histidine kinase/CheY-like chemotaxis protein